MNTKSALLTDYYQFTMAYGYWQLNRAEQEGVFQLTFRKHPFNGNYTISCGLAAVIEFLAHYHFTEEDIEYLARLTSSTNHPAFSSAFLQYLNQLKFTCDVDAIPEGTLVFPHEPLLRISGPLIQCQLLETPLINLMNFASLIATRTAQICQITQNEPVIEFGLRRAQGPDGGLTASRSAYVGGCEAVSNVLAGKTYGIPVSGTLAHSWIMSYSDELTAFEDFVKVTDTTVLLVDTYDTMQGVNNALKVGQQLRQQGRDLAAIRLDSGDLLTLSKKARQMLDNAGFTATKIIGSGDLSFDKIATLKSSGAPIDMWGVGTKLITAYEQPSLDAIYKLTAIRENNQWQYKMKLSDEPEKMTSPGIQQVRRYSKQQQIIADVIYDIQLGINEKLPPQTDQAEDLLVPIFRQGKLVYQQPAIVDIRDHCRKQVARFAHVPSQKKFAATLEPQLQKIKDALIKQA